MSFWGSYKPHDAYVEPTKAYAALWRLVLGVLVTVFGLVILRELLFQTACRLAGSQAFQLYEEVQIGSTPRALLLLLCSFGTLSIGIVVATKSLHRRSARSLIGPLAPALRDFWTVSKAMILLFVVLSVLPPWERGGPLVPNLEFGHWALLLPLSLTGVMIQVSAEEIAFRGYMQQQLAARFASRWIWMGVPSALFALGHYMPETAGPHAGVVVLWAAIFGLLMADLTARSGTLGAAIAVHFWNNVAAILIVSIPDDLYGLALYIAPFGFEDPEAMRAWMPVDFMLMFVSWLAARLALRR